MININELVSLLKYIVLIILSYITSTYINYYIFSTTTGIFSIFISFSILHYIYKKFSQTNEFINIENKAVLITGCDSGFGYNTALRLNEKGFRVYATVLNESSSTKIIENAKFKDRMVVIRMNVTDDQNIRDVYDYISNDINQNNYILWSIVNNAGILHAAPLDWGSFKSCFDLIDVNFLGVIRVTRTFLPLIRKFKGRIINVSSAAGRFVVPKLAYYCSSKHATTAFTNCLRLEMKKYGIKVSIIEPGSFDTKLLGSDCNKNLINDLWENTDADIKNFYGNEEFFQNYLKNTLNSLSKLPKNSNLDIVANNILDAIINVNPKFRYRPCESLFEQVLYFILEYFPYCISDKLLDLLDTFNLL